jgi:hypothetical protein
LQPHRLRFMSGLVLGGVKLYGRVLQNPSSLAIYALPIALYGLIYILPSQEFMISTLSPTTR